MTVDDIEVLLKDTEHNGYPVVVSRENQYLVGFILRKDLNLAIGEWKSWKVSKNFLRMSQIFPPANEKRSIEGITGQSLVIFTNNTPVQNLGPSPLNLKKILDMAPITVTDSTPMETVVDMFRKLGLRQTLVTHNGWVDEIFHTWPPLIFPPHSQSTPRCHHQKRRPETREKNGQWRSEHDFI